MTNDLRGRVAERRNGGRGQRQTGKASKELAVKAKAANCRQMLEQMKPQFQMALPKHIGVDRFLRMAMSCVQKNDTLLDCDPVSVMAALMEAARLGLEPGTKQAAIVPFAGKATFIAQWQGLVELMYRSGQVASVTAEFIHEGDEWDYSIGDGGGFRHKPNLLGDRGKPVLVYAFATMKSGARSKIVFLTREDAEKIRDERSKNYQRAETNGKRNSTWHTDFDAMWRKSAVRRLADWVPSSPELRDLISREDDAGELDLADIVLPEDIVDADIVDDEPEGKGEQPADGPGRQEDQAAEPGQKQDEQPEPPRTPEEPPAPPTDAGWDEDWPPVSRPEGGF
ncbi:recombinase RecT [Microbispora rosea]|uniref:recombinase RecT n=1 Tax=Microbispora rosea TaxID=58117 RepID=UPI003438E266